LNGGAVDSSVASTVYPSGERNAAIGKLPRLPLLGRGVAVVLDALDGSMCVPSQGIVALRLDVFLLPISLSSPAFSSSSRRLLFWGKQTSTTETWWSRVHGKRSALRFRPGHGSDSLQVRGQAHLSLASKQVLHPYSFARFSTDWQLFKQ
jgi:hypothetical protein